HIVQIDQGLAARTDDRQDALPHHPPDEILGDAGVRVHSLEFGHDPGRRAHTWDGVRHGQGPPSRWTPGPRPGRWPRSHRSRYRWSAGRSHRRRSLPAGPPRAGRRTAGRRCRCGQGRWAAACACAAGKTWSSLLFAPFQQQPEGFAAFGCYHGLDAAPLGLVVEALLHLKQTVVLLGVGHQLAFLVAVDVLALLEKADEGVLAYPQLLGGVPETGQQVAVYQLVEVVRLGGHDG